MCAQEEEEDLIDSSEKTLLHWAKKYIYLVSEYENGIYFLNFGLSN